MTLNPNVNVDTEYNQYVDKFYPDAGYALWRDNEEGNLDDNGQPMQYYLQYQCQKRFSEAEAPHVWSKLIDETMEVFGNTGTPEVATYGLRRTVAASEPSHTYIDENGVEREKKGVY